MPSDRNPVTWTAAQVLADVRRKASLPATSTDWTDAVILREATDALWSFAGWALAQGGEGRLLASLDRPVSGALTGAFGQREFVLPPHAVASTVDNITWTDATGQTQSRLARMDHAEEPVWTGPQETGSPAMYTLLADRVRVYPAPNTGGTLRITYQRRHPELIAEGPTATASLASAVQQTATTTLLTQGSTVPWSIGDAVDVLRNSHPYAAIVTGAEVLSYVPTTAFVIDQPAAMFTGHEVVGARIVRSGQSPYVHLPLELRAAFTEKVCANILRTVGDLSGMAACEQAAMLELSRAMMLLSPRGKRDKPFVVNPHSHMRLGMGRGRW